MPTGGFETNRTVQAERHSPQASRKLVVGVVVLAVLLSALGMVLALQQSQLLVAGRVAELRPEAYRRVASVNRAATSEIERTFADVELYGCRATTRPALDDAAHAGGSEPLPRAAWLRELLVWDEDRLYRCSIGELPPLPQTDVGRLEPELRSRLDMILVEAREGASPAPQSYLYSPPGSKPVLVVYGPVRPGGGELMAAVALVDLDFARRDLVDRLVGTEGDLTVVSTGVQSPESGATSATWSESLGPVFPFWSVQPSSRFMLEQERIGLRQTLLYAGVTILGLVALLLAIRAMNRVVQHEISLSRMKANFVADVSHELKTPLALIRMFAETLLSGRVQSEDKAREYYDIITRESTRLTHLIDNILDFSRIDAGRKHYRRELVDVGRVVRETYDAYRHELDYHGFEHHCTIAEDLPGIHGDDDAIGQVVLNLISNAIKYSADEKHLHVDVMPEVRRDRRGVLICVRDRGIGIRPEDRAHLFEGFYRAPDERVRQSRGTGLGLALCKKIVDAHGGCIDVESRLVKGSEFRVFLPEDHDTSEQKE